MNKETNDNSDVLFIIVAEAEGYERSLTQTEFPFGRLIDEIVVPFKENKPFFVDGAPLTRSKIKKLKILKESKRCLELLNDFHWQLRQWTDKEHKHLADQYHVRFEAILRETGDDVTSQIIKAFDTTIKPSLKDYLPKR